VHTPVPGLTHTGVREALARLVVASFLGGWNIEDYLRIRFKGNSSAVGFWDEEAMSGVTLVDGDTQDFDTLEPPWPDWFLRLEGLQDAIAVTSAHRDPSDPGAG